MKLDRISIEPTRRCSKGCTFCYNGSNSDGDGDWSASDVIDLARDCAKNGVRAISFGGGEPLEWEPIFDVLESLKGTLFRSLTTNGLLLDDVVDRLAIADKVHVSIHAPENSREVERVIRQVGELSRVTKSGVNLLVRRSRLDDAKRAADRLHEAGIGNDRIVFLPMRGPVEVRDPPSGENTDTPFAKDVAAIAGGPFQSMTCLSGCGKSERFASIGADRTVAWCSYTRSRRKLVNPTFESIVGALTDLDLEPCANGLVRLTRPDRIGTTTRPSCR